MQRSPARGSFDFFVVAATSLAILALCGAAIASGTTQIIAITGDTAPDGNGTFSTFSRIPALNNAGKVAFSARLAGTVGGTTDDRGLYLTDGSQLAQVARSGQSVPDGNGAYSHLGDHMLNDESLVAFSASVVGSTNPGFDFGVFLASSSSVAQVARTGQAAPDGNEVFRNPFNWALNSAGQVLFETAFTTGNENAIYLSSGASVSEIVHKGQAAPGGGSFTGRFDAALNNHGQVAFADFIDGPISNNGGIYTSAGGAIAPVVAPGQPAPDGDGYFFGVGSPIAINDAGYAAFWANFEAPSGEPYDGEGVFLGSHEQLIQVARAGQTAPADDGRFNWFSSPALNQASEVAFTANVAPTSGGEAYDALFFGTAATLTELVRRGSPAPDGNGVFRDFVGFPIANDAGQVAFQARLMNTGSGSTDFFGIFLVEGSTVVQVARLGDVLAGSTITTLELASYAHERNGMNDLGQVAYWARLSDGREVIALWTPPLTGDLNGDGIIDAADYVFWRKNGGAPVEYNAWRANFGIGGTSLAFGQPAPPAVPEPGTASLLLVCIVSVAVYRSAIRER